MDSHDQSRPAPPPPPPLLAPPVIVPPPAPPRRTNGWRVTAILLFVLIGLVVLSNGLSILRGPVRHHRLGQKYDRPLEEVTVEYNGSRHNIAVIEVEGIITSESLDRVGMTLVELVDKQLRAAADDASVKAVILKVNSPGGEVLASDEINKAISKFQTDSRKPVVASMGTLAASGGYYISAPCQWIVANELTITGSIGVIMHGYNFRGLMDKVGIRPEVYKSGRFKDMLSMDKTEQEITPEERAMVQKLIDETFQKFKEVVTAGRKEKLSGNWEEYADGRILSGKQAKELGFVDQTGNFEAAIQQAQTLARIPDSNLIQYRQPFDFGSLFRLFGKSEGASLKIDLGASRVRLQPGLLYFITPTVLH